MSKLNQWLESQGMVKTQPQQTPPSSEPQKKEEERPPVTDSAAKAPEKKPFHKPRPEGQKPHGPRREGGGGKPFSGGGRDRGKPPVLTQHDPSNGRPTHEKREKFHPTNFLPGKAGEIRVVPLGGMEQVGLNMAFIEWGDEILILDMGLLFPSAQHYGVDVLVPDIAYLKKNKKKIRGIFFTHGHLDHIGAAPYLLEELDFPTMYASRLTKELIFATCSEHLDVKRMKIVELNPKSNIKLGKFDLEFFHVNHSIPDSLGLVVNTPYGAIVHTSDFKIDHNPADDMPANLGRIAQIGDRGVVLAMIDSTNATRPGHTLSESVIEGSIAKIIKQTEGRLIITTFASTIGRISKIVEAAEACGRTVFLSGRSMERNLLIARKLNYLKCKDKTIQLMNRKANAMDPSKVLILSTGSQGEELAALTRMAAGVHRDVTLNTDDTILFSSSPIPGNELQIVSVMNNLAEIGCKIIEKGDMDVYVSGHGHKEEVKLMATLLNPKYYVPVHGEIAMRYGNRNMAIKELGYKEENTFIMKNGQGVVLNPNGCRLMNEKEALIVPPVMIEMGETIGQHILADRSLMVDNGIIIIHIDHNNGSFKKTNIRSRGFRYMNMEHEIFKLLETEVKNVFTRSFDTSRPMKALEETLKKAAEKVIYQKFRQEIAIEVIL